MQKQTITRVRKRIRIRSKPTNTDSNRNVQVIDKYYSLTGLDGNVYQLTIQQKTFCDTYLTFGGNGVEAALEAYDCKDRRSAASVASRVLTEPNIIAYINSKLEESGFNDDNVRKQHLFLLNQHSDFNSKSKAVDMFYKLKGNYAPEQIEHTHSLADIEQKAKTLKEEIRALESPEGEIASEQPSD